MPGSWTGPLLVGVILAAATALSGAPDDKLFDTPEGLVRALYEEVTFEAGTAPDWKKMRSMFIDEAIFVLRGGKGTEQSDLDGFVKDFQKFASDPEIKEKGFQETITRMKVTVFRDLAHVLVLYDTSVPGSKRKPYPAVDSFHLVRRDGRWWIVSVLNDIPTEDHPVPEELKGK